MEVLYTLNDRATKAKALLHGRIKIESGHGSREFNNTGSE